MTDEQRIAQFADWILSTDLTGIEPNAVLAIVATFMGAHRMAAEARIEALEKALRVCDEANGETILELEWWHLFSGSANSGVLASAHRITEKAIDKAREARAAAREAIDE